MWFSTIKYACLIYRLLESITGSMVVKGLEYIGFNNPKIQTVLIGLHNSYLIQLESRYLMKASKYFLYCYNKTPVQFFLLSICLYVDMTFFIIISISHFTIQFLQQWEGIIELLGSESKPAGGLEFLHKYEHPMVTFLSCFHVFI